MIYILHMYGKWLDRSGKMQFDSIDSLEDYLWDMLFICHKAISKEIGVIHAMEKLHLSYSIYQIGDNSPLKKAFRTTPVIPQIIFTSRKRDSYESTTRKTDRCVEKCNEIGHGCTEGDAERGCDSTSRDKANGLPK